VWAWKEGQGQRPISTEPSTTTGGRTRSRTKSTSNLNGKIRRRGRSESQVQGLPKGLALVSADEGREYHVYLPSGAVLSGGSMLTRLELTKAEGAQRAVGLCKDTSDSSSEDWADERR